MTVTTGPAWLRDLLGPTAVVQRVLGGGTSRETLLVSVTPHGAPLVVRHESGAGPFHGTPFSLGREAAVCAALVDSGLPIPRPVAVARDGTAWAGTRLVGVTASRGEALEDHLRHLALLHVGAHESIAHRGLDPAGRDDPRIWRDLAARIRERPPLVEAALARWPDPDPSRVVLCHGDAGPGNYLVEDGRATGLVDWELAHTGDPHDDLASVAIRARLTGLELDDLAGLVDHAYRPVTGHGIDPDRFVHASIGVLTRMVISCHLAIGAADASKDRSVQVMGLPVMEAHLLDLLARVDGITLPPIDPPPDARYRLEIERLLAEGDGGDPSRRRRHDHLARQLDGGVAGAQRATADLVSVPDPHDLLALHHAVRARLAVLPASVELADRPLPGAPWN